MKEAFWVYQVIKRALGLSCGSEVELLPRMHQATTGGKKKKEVGMRFPAFLSTSKRTACPHWAQSNPGKETKSSLQSSWV
jgi:hypothetical protein